MVIASRMLDISGAPPVIMTKIREKKLLEKIAKKYSLELILLFGSRASQQNYKGSDFDVAYLSKRDLALEQEAKLIIELAPIFKSENIDLVNFKKASPLLLKHIFQNHLVLFCSEKKTYNLYKIYAIKRYIEAGPIFKLRDELIEKYFSKK